MDGSAFTGFGTILKIGFALIFILGGGLLLFAVDDCRRIKNEHRVEEGRVYECHQKGGVVREGKCVKLVPIE